MAFRRTMVAGLIIVLPVIVTYWLIALLFDAINGTLTPVLTMFVGMLAPPKLLDAWRYLAPFFSIVLSVSVIYFIGLVGGNVLGRQILNWGEGLVMRIPVVRGIYSAIRQFVDTFSRPEGSAFGSVVLLEFPREGSWSLGLVAGNASGEVAARLPAKMLSVFVPTSPNPTSGYIVFLPEAKVVRLEMSVDDALKMIISGGALMPERAAATTSVEAPRKAG